MDPHGLRHRVPLLQSLNSGADRIGRRQERRPRRRGAEGAVCAELARYARNRSGTPRTGRARVPAAACLGPGASSGPETTSPCAGIRRPWPVRAAFPAGDCRCGRLSGRRSAGEVGTLASLSGAARRSVRCAAPDAPIASRAPALTVAAATATMAESSAHERGEAHHAISAPVQPKEVPLCGTKPVAAHHSALSEWCSIRPSPHWQLDHSCRCSVPRLRPLPLCAKEADDRGARSGAVIGFLSFPELEEDGSQGNA